VKAFRAIDTFSGRSSLSTWLYSVTRSVCHDWYRGRTARARLRESEIEDAPDSGDPQDLLLESKEGVVQLWSAIKQLEPEFRIPVVLFDIEGLPYEEIARIERVPVGTVRSRISRGRQKLRDALTKVAWEPKSSGPGTRAPGASSDSPERLSR
jgi:RNA polymerase sigma-70 factor (ECF subfamily)